MKEIRLQNIAAQTGVPQARPGRAAKPLQQQLAELDPNADPAETAKKPWTRWVFSILGARFVSFCVNVVSLIKSGNYVFILHLPLHLIPVIT